MKNLISALALLFVAAGAALAESPPPGAPQIDGHDIQAVFQSTFTKARHPNDTAGIQNSVGIATQTAGAYLHTVVVSSAGGNSFFAVWDCQASTSNAGCRLIAHIGTDERGTYTYDVAASSGLKMQNYGDVPAGVTVTYRERPKRRPIP